jgi:hypothetical protein
MKRRPHHLHQPGTLDYQSPAAQGSPPLLRQAEQGRYPAQAVGAIARRQPGSSTVQQAPTRPGQAPTRRNQLRLRESALQRRSRRSACFRARIQAPVSYQVVFSPWRIRPDFNVRGRFLPRPFNQRGLAHRSEQDGRDYRESQGYREDSNKGTKCRPGVWVRWPR